MHMSMSLSCTMRLSLDVTGGLTESIFPCAELMLHETEYQQALEYAGARKNMDKYRSMVDFLFCEIFTLHRPGAFAFYRGEGPQLRFLINEKQRAYFEVKMIEALEVAYDAFCEERALSWAGLRRRVLGESA